MIKFVKPRNLNGAQLLDELKTVGIIVNGIPLIDGNDEFWLGIDAKDSDKAQEVLNTHIPKPRPELTVEEKLASVGLNLDNLKQALGL